MVDVLIIGGGPAGATAARLLASWGWSVLVAHRSPAGRTSLAESLPPSTRKLLAFLGLLDAVDAAGFHPNLGNLAQWAGALRRTDTDAPGLHVSRAAFDRVLRRSARSAGARVVHAVVRRVEFGDLIRIDSVTADGRARTDEARSVLDCSGRAGVIARRGLRRDEPGYRTIAISAEWTCRSWAPDERAHTIVESYRDGWAWSVPLSATRRQCTVMVAPQRAGDRAATRGPTERLALQRVYDRELSKARAVQARLAAARQTSRVWGSDASLYHAPRAADGRALLVGDAASFIEPLSAAGVKKALTSAWRAAVVANTCLAKPEMADAASSFHSRREREIYTECRRLSAGFFGEASAVHDDPFWTTRARTMAEPAADLAPSDDELARDPQVRDAFERLRRSPLVRLRPARTLRIESAAAIEGREVVMRDAVVLPGVETPVRFAAGVNLPALVRLARHCDEVSTLMSAYQSEVGPVPVHGLLTGLSLLVAHRALIDEGSSV